MQFPLPDGEGDGVGDGAGGVVGDTGLGADVG